jgi:hypothetical protein
MSDPQTNQAMAARFLALTDGLKGESDRGCVVLAVAWIEDDLTRLLKRHLLPSPRTSESSDELFGVQGYLGTFSAKIDLAYRLGLIRRSVHQCLHLGRRIRNDFAHLSGDLSFSTPSISDRVSEIFRLNEDIIQLLWSESFENALPEEIRKNTSGLSGVRSFEHIVGTRKLFEITAGMIVVGLTLALSQVTPIQRLGDK